MGIYRKVPGRLKRVNPARLYEGCIPLKEFAASVNMTPEGVKRWIPKGKIVGYKHAYKWFVRWP